MDTLYQQQFLQQRIGEIGSALFHNQSTAVLKLPSAIVTTVKPDDYGFVWFLLEKPKQNLNEFEQEFPVKMDFYRKGKGYFLQVAGRGYIVTDPEEMNGFVGLPEEMKELLTDNTILVKMKMQKADYYESRSVQKIGWWQQAWTLMTTWFRHNGFRPGTTFYPAS